ncbi:MAG: GNAT family N-acetyltransferase [Candidatus Lokiarchaeota archaeon]|nr:GNAT family N-acetyltransferase [Candidatus Lokiarchaeota archaeon]
MTNKHNFTFFQGDIVDLVPLNSQHINHYVKWENNPSVRIYSRNIIPRTVEDMNKFFEPSEDKIKREINFEIWHKKDKKPIGFGEVAEIDWYGQLAFLGLIIGEPEYWGQNIGEEATRLLVEYAFNELNLFKLYAGMNSANIGSWRCAEKNGFTREATFKKGCYVDGKYYDEFRYSLFKEDWLKFKKQIDKRRKK